MVGVGVSVKTPRFVDVGVKVAVEVSVKPAGLVAVGEGVAVGVQVPVRVAMAEGVEVCGGVAVAVNITGVAVHAAGGWLGTSICRLQPTIRATARRTIALKTIVCFFTLPSPQVFQNARSAHGIQKTV